MFAHGSPFQFTDDGVPLCSCCPKPGDNKRSSCILDPNPAIFANVQYGFEMLAALAEPIMMDIHTSDTLKVCLVLKDRGWILEKFAIRLAENLPNWNVNADITLQPSPTADINHWMGRLNRVESFLGSLAG
jgi:hypothetical protein